ncbi:MAG: tripartite tricarboxylate transporter TctB family protein [Alphaproteobacteria bacterium]
MPEPGPGGARRTAELAVAAVILALAAVVFWQASVVPSTPLYAKIGPKAFPYGVAVMLAILGVGIGIEAWRGGWPNEWRDRDWPIDGGALGWVLAGLVLNVALIQLVGFVLAATLLFACVARAFGSRRPLVDLAVGFVLALLVFVGFDLGLGIRIGAGPLEALI